MHPFKAFSFDLWNTLIVSNPQFKEARNAFLGEFWGVSLDALAPALAYLDKELDKKAERTGAQVNFGERMQLLVQKLACPALDSAQLAYLEDEQTRIFLENLPTESEERVGELLRVLQSRGVRLFLVSNTGFVAGKTLRMALERLDIGGWEASFFSDEVGVSKPDKRIFAPICAQTDLKPAEILHIGDNFLTDYNGARKMGFHSCLYTKNLRTFDTHLDTLEHLWDLLKYTA